MKLARPFILLGIVVLFSGCPKKPTPAAAPDPAAGARGGGSATDPVPSAFGVLNRIEKYVAPVFPKDGPRDGQETYDYRTSEGAPVPATKVDTLVVDVHLLIEAKSSVYATVTDIPSAIDLYRTHPRPVDIIGYRGWTHAHFVRSLTDAERTTLGDEIARYAKEKGVNDPQKSGEEMEDDH